MKNKVMSPSSGLRLTALQSFPRLGPGWSTAAPVLLLDQAPVKHQDGGRIIAKPLHMAGGVARIERKSGRTARETTLS